ncbi:hypothetical protein KKD52_01560 [Myxococcota bacterium]|nr:hypothetical protein [Myxococcota bacterium]
MRNLCRVSILWFVVACSPASSPSPKAGAAVKAPESGVPAPVMKAGPTPEAPGTLAEGPLEISKMNPFVQGWMLPQDELSERFGPKWRTRLAGRRLRVRGVTEVYVCPPDSQCLVEGRIPRFAQVTELGLLCKNGETLVVPRACPSPHCLKGCERRVMTRHDACGRNAGPDWPDWCGQSNDQMRRDCEMTCQSGCPAGSTAPVWCD